MKRRIALLNGYRMLLKTAIWRANYAFYFRPKMLIMSAKHLLPEGAKVVPNPQAMDSVYERYLEEHKVNYYKEKVAELSGKRN